MGEAMRMWAQRYLWDTDCSGGVERTGGPERVVTSEKDPDFKRRRVGFTSDLEEVEENG
jgi:hypothetical protein